jgi:S1-C subfamily serine protease
MISHVAAFFGSFLRVLVSLFGPASLDEAVQAKSVSCVRPLHVAESVFRLERSVPGQREKGHGTGFMIGQHEMVTVRHVVRNMQLGDEWREVEAYQEHTGIRRPFTMLVRIKAILTGSMPDHDGLAVLELRQPLGAPVKPLAMRTRAPRDGEFAVGIGYPDGRFGVAPGVFVSKTWRPPPSRPDALGFELVSGTNRDVHHSGSSGGPIVDCAGEVVGVISDCFPDLPRSLTALVGEFIPLRARRREANVWAVPMRLIEEYIRGREL